jgi:hypothetical protein
MKNFVTWLVENFTDDETKVANKTARAAGAVGEKAIVPRHVEEVEAKHNAKGKRHILDFGSGDKAAHTQRLRAAGHHVTAHEFGSNQKEGVHDPHALDKKYHHVFASNVLNVQSNKKMMGHTLDQIHKATHKGGAFTGNFPASPRKAADIDHTHVENELKKRFHNVERVKGKGTRQAPLFHATHPKEDYKPGE